LANENFRKKRSDGLAKPDIVISARLRQGKFGA
jgi:hypothetical protein